VYQVFTYVLGFVLVFRINLAYGRWWEGRGHIEQMSSQWFDVAQQACCFDQFTDASEKEKQLFRLQLTGLMSVLHACATRELCHGAQVPCLLNQLVSVDGSMSWLQAMVQQESFEPVNQAMVWVYMAVTDRFCLRYHDQEPGAQKVHDVPSPILSRLYEELSNGMLGFHNAIMIKVTPFPFPFVQLISLALFLYMLTMPLCVDFYVDHIAWASIILIVAEFGIFGLSEVAIDIEQPFGDDDTDLPLIDYHVCFDLNLRALVDALTYETPAPNKDVFADGKYVAPPLERYSWTSPTTMGQAVDHAWPKVSTEEIGPGFKGDGSGSASDGDAKDLDAPDGLPSATVITKTLSPPGVIDS
jgi:predicted membrane chloride channel (bestrophin family)